MVYKCINDMAPAQLIERVVSFKNKAMLILKCVQFNTREGRCFSYIGPRLWNEIPFEIKALSNIESFKKQLKTLLYNDFEHLKSRVFRYMV